MNEAAERLRRLLGQERREELHDLALNGLLDAALDFERKATVERIRAALGITPEEPDYFDREVGHIRGALDAEAER